MEKIGIKITQSEVISFLGSRICKEEDPLENSKIDFIDFLGLIVNNPFKTDLKKRVN